MADPKATPISALPRGPTSQKDDEQFIQNILNQMNDDNAESEQAYAQQQAQYQQQQFAVDAGKQHQQNQEQLQQQAQYEQMGEEGYEQQYQYEEVPEPTFSEKVKENVKRPLLFFVLYVILSMPFVRTFAMNQVARFTQSAAKQLYGTTLLLGLLGGVVFYLVTKFAF